MILVVLSYIGIISIVAFVLILGLLEAWTATWLPDSNRWLFPDPKPDESEEGK